MARLSRFAWVGLLSALLAGPAFAQENPLEDPRVQEITKGFQKAIQELQAKRYDDSIASYEKLLAQLESYDWLPDEFRDEYRQLCHYNLACAHSLKGDVDPAIEHFERAVKLGFDDRDHIRKDTDLDAIRDDARFKRIVAGLRGQRRRDPLAGQKRALVRSISKTKLFDFDFDLETVHGDRVRLSDLKGKVVLVDVWGTWCPPCRRQIPHLIKLQDRLGDRGLQIVGLNWEKVPAEKAPETVRAFIEKTGIPYPCALVPRTLLDTIPEFRGFPTVLLIDRAGRVRLKKVGFTEGPVLAAAVETLLNERAPTAPKKAAPKKAAPKKKAPKKHAPAGGELF